MSLTEQQVRNALQQVHYPGYSRDIISFGFLKSIAVTDGKDVNVLLQIATREPSIVSQLQRDIENTLRTLPGIGRIVVDIQTSTPPSPNQGTVPTPERIPGIRRVIAVGSGKGGVGKSTVAVNLACALASLGWKVGLLDADIYGPSIPKMLGTLEQPTVQDDRIVPIEKHGIKLMSMALLLDPNQAVIWRGPMIMKALRQFAHEVQWGELDALLVDLPPGTGDAQISLSQLLVLDGAVIVTTPQEVAMEVVARGVSMFQKVNVRILGLIENMSYYLCPHCGGRDDVFGHDGARKQAKHLSVPLLGQIPLNADIRACGDHGDPIVLKLPGNPASIALRQCAETLQRQLP